MSMCPFRWWSSAPAAGEDGRLRLPGKASGRGTPPGPDGVPGPTGAPGSPGSDEATTAACSHQVKAAAAGDGRAPGRDPELAVDRPEVGLDRVDREEQGVRDLLVGQVGGQQPEHGQLAEGERRRLD